MSNSVGPDLSLFDVLLPQVCALCSSVVVGEEADQGVCTGCVGRLTHIVDPRCSACGMALVGEGPACARCAERSYRFADARALFEYRGLVRELLYQYKFQGRRCLSRLFAGFLAVEWRLMYPDTIVVPAPSRPGSARRRSWEHVGEITRQLQRCHKVPVVRCLGRKTGPPQKTLSFEDRSHNLHGRITCHGGDRISDKWVVLLDDLFTTGATADECTRVLLAQGAARVSVLVVAIDL